jgi:hypothetical protein
MLRINYVARAAYPSSSERQFAIVNHNQQILWLKGCTDAGSGQVSRLETFQPYM